MTNTNDNILDEIILQPLPPLPPLKLTRSAACGHCCLNRMCKNHRITPTIQHAIDNGTFGPPGMYYYYTQENNMTWSTLCYFCSDCTRSKM